MKDLKLEISNPTFVFLLFILSILVNFCNTTIQATLSKIPAAPMPPPTHIVTIP
jgi:hypothetical protein